MNQLFELWSLVYYLVVQGFGLVLAGVAAIIFLYIVLRKLHSLQTTLILIACFAGAMLFFWFPIGVPQNLSYPFGITTYGPSDGPTLPLKNVFQFFRHLDTYERVQDIARNPLDVPPAINASSSREVDIHLTSKEVLAEMAPGVVINYWTFDGTVPGPMLRVRQGDTVHLTLTNDPSSLHMHSIDLHAVTGPGGGATVTDVQPGESKTMTFKALNPGLYVYHCAHPNVANHMAHGMYGLILVEPEGGLPQVDREMYVMQGEFYTAGARGTKGLQVVDAGKMLDGNPEYVVFNGRTGAVSKDKIAFKTGDRVRMYVGNGGVNLVSSFHVIGEIFDTVYPEAAMGSSAHEIGGAAISRAEVHHNVQSTMVPAGGATIVEFTSEVPGNYILVDHALARLDKGAWGTFSVLGDARPDIFFGTSTGAHSGH